MGLHLQLIMRQKSKGGAIHTLKGEGLLRVQVMKNSVVAVHSCLVQKVFFRLTLTNLNHIQQA